MCLSEMFTEQGVHPSARILLTAGAAASPKKEAALGPQPEAPD